MRPLSVVTLIVLGSSFGITVSLGAVAIIMLLLGDDSPRLQHEFRPVLKSLAIFLTLTAISAVSFYTSVKTHQARFWSQAAMWSAVFATGWYFWP